MRKELIGKKIKIIESKNKTNKGIKGKVIDETKNTITIDDKKFIKKNITFEIDGKIIEGKDIMFRPEERIKKVKNERKKEHRY